MLRGLRPRVVLPLYILAIIAVSVVPSGGGVPLWNLDKVGHYLAYTGLAVLVCIRFDGPARRVWGLLGAIALGAALELIQSQIPGRDMSLLDGLVNTAGVLTGLAIFTARGREVRRLASIVFGGQGWQ